MAEQPEKSDKNQYHTVGNYALMIARVLEEYGHNPEPFFREEGIELSKLDDVNFRLSEIQLTRLWKMAVRVTGNVTIGIEAGTKVTPTSFHALSMSLYLCSDIKSGLERFLRYTIIFTTSASGTLTKRAKDYIFEIDNPLSLNGEQVVCNESIDAFLAAFITICRSRCGQSYRLEKAEFTREKPDDCEIYQRFLDCPLVFGSDKCRFYFSHDSLETPITTGNTELFELTEQAIRTSMNQLNEDQILAKIRRSLKDLLPSGEYKIDDVALCLNMSSRALQRKLQDIGLSYRELVDDYRRELAITYIRQPDMSQGEISFQLGFSATSNFSRAFKNWTGVAPGQYQESVS
ncbi:MAG: AraC family transcriptional regulator [Pseudomonadales bacterium]